MEQLGLYTVLLNINMSAGRQETKMVDCDALNPAHVDNSDCVYRSADANNGYEGIMQADAEYISCACQSAHRKYIARADQMAHAMTMNSRLSPVGR